MDFQERLDKIRLEYWASLAADPRYQDPDAPNLLHLDDAPSFYDYLLSRGFSRFQLSAQGIGRDIEP